MISSRSLLRAGLHLESLAIAAIAVNPGYLIDALGGLAGVQLPASFSYINRTSSRNSGIEVGLTDRRGNLGGFLNYS